MKIILTPKAEGDLDRIGEYIAIDNPVRAASFVDELLDRCASLAEFPERFPIVQRYKRHHIRRCLHGDYLIFYRVEADLVRILHILHGAVDYDQLLGQA
jgi:addiction module RelE/StbE family toxin